MKNKRASSKRDKKDIKVTYISSPVKVKTSASNFRALVQELTGQDSNVAEMTSMSLDAKDCDDERVVHNYKGFSTHQQWRVDVPHQGYLHEATALLKPDYSEFLSKSLVEPLNQQHVQYDLLSFDMS